MPHQRQILTPENFPLIRLESINQRGNPRKEHLRLLGIRGIRRHALVSEHHVANRQHYSSHHDRCSDKVPDQARRLHLYKSSELKNKIHTRKAASDTISYQTTGIALEPSRHRLSCGRDTCRFHVQLLYSPSSSWHAWNNSAQGPGMNKTESRDFKQNCSIISYISGN
ncbi:hypothetical protein SAY86_027153 [Trapa natans]|uniref:Uncharacterized protein n=1 Tax=Trapa natans TaxID=22666 RepID=A0AAN7KH04_TRANT|nr:hypothetical protein SAY86_027153 [Trapa natans]